VLLTSLFWLILAFGILLLLQRSLHSTVQTTLFYLTRRADLAIVLFSILFFPGVLVHELSHYIVARLTGVRTGRLSLLPHPMPNGRLRLGYVETAAADPVRETLIGAAPLVSGSLLVAYIGINRLGLPALWNQIQSGGLTLFPHSLAAVSAQQDFWIWFYLLFTISSMMLPSASDRRAWLPMAIVGIALLLLVIAAGAGPWLLKNIEPVLPKLFKGGAVIFFISDFTHLFFLLPVMLIEMLMKLFLSVPSMD
jgi:hypothetical protein